MANLCTLHNWALININVVWVCPCGFISVCCRHRALVLTGIFLYTVWFSPSGLPHIDAANKSMCHLLIFQACCLSPAHFQFSIYLLNCGTAGASKPSSPSLVESIVRQQALRCPFLVISWGNECYHNPLLVLLPYVSLFPVSHLQSLSLAWSRIPLFSLFLAPLTLYLCNYCAAFIWTGLFSFCCILPPLCLMASLVVLMWSGTLCGWLDCQAWSARRASAHQKLGCETVVLH